MKNLENLLEQFRLDTIPVITKPESFGHGKQVILDQMRFQFIRSTELADDEMIGKLNGLLWQVQLTTGDSEDASLSRFGHVSQIVIDLTPKEDVLDELTKVADRYIKQFRKSKAGAFIERDLGVTGENEVANFRDKLTEIQAGLLKSNSF